MRVRVCVYDCGCWWVHLINHFALCDLCCVRNSALFDVRHSVLLKSAAHKLCVLSHAAHCLCCVYYYYRSQLFPACTVAPVHGHLGKSFLSKTCCVC